MRRVERRADVGIGIRKRFGTRKGELVYNPRGKKRGHNYAGVRLEVDDIVEAIHMASECELNSAPPIKRRGETTCKRKLSSPDPPERIEGEKDLKRELKKLKQKFAKEYEGSRVCAPKIFFLL
ncbi:hypothetical protein R1flu_013396 [Riccia fluitans]|uniref:Uncharacterized protein n=1 Tax=Riccia fluitans TaxID=41844 RepID=A0ABD1YDG9_9MARC